MNKIKVIIKRPDEKVGHMTWISDTLENLQKTVEGHIEVVRITKNVVMICNEEGKIRELETNFSMGMPPFNDVIRGTVIIAGTSGEDFGDVPINIPVWKALLASWGNPI